MKKKKIDYIYPKTKEEIEEWVGYNPDRIILNEEDIKWIKDNMVIGDVEYDMYAPFGRTPIYLQDKKYYFNTNREFYDGLTQVFNIKSDKSFEDMVLDQLIIEVSFKSTTPIQLIRTKKLRKILG